MASHTQTTLPRLNPMAQPPPTRHTRPLDPLAALLSYLFPGLGQILQGRVAKGLLFFVCIYALFFYGMAMGQMKNVWLPNASKLPDTEMPFIATKLGGVAKAIAYRQQFLGQFWIGVAAWPAVVQYFASDPDAVPNANGLPVIRTYMSTPTEEELNKLQRDGNKRWDLGWVYTLIAGVLNLLVIYDALAGPAVRDEDFEDVVKEKPKGPPPNPPLPVETTPTANPQGSP